MDATGRCLCGQVSFKATGVEPHVHSCHCDMCRRWSGGPALAAQAESVVFEGEENVTRYGSSEWAQRGFCSVCGTNLFYEMRDGSMTMLWLGAVDDLAPYKLVGEIYIDEKPGLYDFAGDRPRLTGKEFIASLGLDEGAS